MVVVFRFDECDRNIGFVVENVVCELAFSAGDQLTTYDDAPFGKEDLFADLRENIPADLLNGRRDETGADIAFGEVFLCSTPASLHSWSQDIRSGIQLTYELGKEGS